MSPAPNASNEPAPDEQVPDESAATQRARTHFWPADGGAPEARDEALAREAPLAIEVDGSDWGVVLRTPGHDLELVSGLLLAEGLVDTPSDVAAIAHCRAPNGLLDPHRVRVTRARRERIPPSTRAWTSSTSCGVCGRVAIDDLASRAPRVEVGPRWSRSMLASLPERMRPQQALFQETGGTHAAALFAPDGRLLVLREDVGRHNAVDKVLGAALRHDLLPLTATALLLSGRLSFELVQKARVAGIPLVAAVSAPSALAVELAQDGGQTLVGFVRGGAFTVYCGSQRLLEGP